MTGCAFLNAIGMTQPKLSSHTPRTFGTDENSKNHLAQNIKASTGYESKTLGESESAPTEKESISAHSKTKSKPLRPTTPPQKSFTPNSQPPTSNPNPPYYRNPPPIRHPFLYNSPICFIFDFFIACKYSQNCTFDNDFACFSFGFQYGRCIIIRPLAGLQRQ